MALTVGVTVLWFVAVPVAQRWHEEWLVRPPVELPVWKMMLMVRMMGFARVWPAAWPLFIGFVWPVSFLFIEFARRFKRKRL